MQEHIRGKGVLFGDLVQEGNIGLLEAMAIYQGKDAEGFLAHAKSAVEDSILDAIAIQRGSDSVGEAMAIKANRLDDASTFLSKELGREPKIEELAKISVHDRRGSQRGYENIPRCSFSDGS